MKTDGLRNIILAGSFILFITSCNSYQFAPNGTVVRGHAKNYYINPDLHLALSVPGDFSWYSKKIKKGVRTDHSYPSDKAVLKKLNLDAKNISILFSAQPQIAPFYNFIAFTPTHPIDVSSYTAQPISNGKKYFYRKFEHNGQEFFEAIIPDGDKQIGLIYYSDISTDCHYCDIQDIAAKNTLKLADDKAYYPDDIKSEYAGTDSAKKVTIALPPQISALNHQGILTLSRLENKSKKFEALYIVPGNSLNVAAEVGAGAYSVTYMDFNHHQLWTSALNVK